MYKFEAEALVRYRSGGNKTRKFQFTYGKELSKWNMNDYGTIEKYLGAKKDVQGDVSIIDIKEIE